MADVLQLSKFRLEDRVRVNKSGWGDSPYLITDIVRTKIYTLRSLDGKIAGGGAEVEEGYIMLA